MDIDIAPDNPDAARIWINASPGDAYLLMGAGCGVELDDASIGEIVSMVEAVANGRFTEHVWFNRRGEVRASIGTAEIGGVVRRYYRNRFRDGTGGQVRKYSGYLQRGSSRSGL